MVPKSNVVYDITYKKVYDIAYDNFSDAVSNVIPDVVSNVGIFNRIGLKVINKQKIVYFDSISE